MNYEEVLNCELCPRDIDIHRDTTGKAYWNQGHNAEPLAEGRCCDICNATKVIPARLEAMRRADRRERRLETLNKTKAYLRQISDNE